MSQQLVLLCETIAPNAFTCFQFHIMGHNSVPRFEQLTSEMRKVAGSRPDEVNEFFSIYLTLPAALGPGVYSASKRNEYRK
jgi:hypothetical protein